MREKSISKKIKLLRLERAWSQAQLAEISSLSIRTVQRIEVNGKCSHESLLALASAFDIDVAELTSLKEVKNEYEEQFSFSLFNLRLRFNWFKSRTALIVGLLMAFPAVFFVSASLLKYGLGISFLFDSFEIFYSSPKVLKAFNFVSPFVFLFGLAGALIINLFVMLSIKIWKDNGIIRSDISFSPVLSNAFISILSFTALTILFLYAFAENFGVM